jgi:hypothetical protein
MSIGAGHERKRRSRGLILLMLILALLIGYATYLYLSSGRKGGGGGDQTTTPGPSAPSNLLYPTRDIVNGYDLIVIEDHVHVENGRYSLVASAAGSFRSLVAYGGSTVRGNITNGAAVIKYGGYDIPVVAFASTNSTIVQDFPGIQVRLDKNGGYVLYKPVSLAIYYRYAQFNISGTAVHVWVPAKTLPTKLADASVHVTIDPEFGVYYINNVAYNLELGTPPQRLKGILRAWLVYTTESGRYVFTINP